MKKSINDTNHDIVTDMSTDTVTDNYLYARRVEDLREASLTVREIAEVAGVDERQVYHWIKGTTRPGGTARERLLDLHYVVEQLRHVYKPEGVDIWLHGRDRDLGGQSPIHLLQQGEFSEIFDAVERLQVGAM